LLSNKGTTINQLVLIFDVHLNTIYNWLNEWESRKLLSLYTKKGQGRKSLLGDDKIEEIKKIVEDSPKELKTVVSKISEKYGIEISTSTLKRYLKKN